MQMKKLSFILILLVLSVGLNSCKKDEQASVDNSNGNQQEQAPSVPKFTFTGPSTSSTDQNVSIVNSIIQNMNASNIPQYRFLDATKSNSLWTRLFVSGDFVVTLTTEEKTDSYIWQMTYNGTNDFTNITYNHTLIMEVYSSKDNKKGNGSIYDNGNIVRTFKWETDTNNNLSGYFIDNTSATSYQRCKVIDNADGSGEVQILPNDVISYKAQWSANGSGQWWNYDSSGTATASGSW